MKLMNAALGLIILATIFWGSASVQIWAPAWHGMISPVVSPLTIEGIERRPDGWTRLSGTATKHKTCAYIRTEWFVGVMGGRAASTRVVHKDKPQARGPGLLSWGKIDVLINPEQVRLNSYAYVYHDCGWPWLVRSLYWTSEG